MELDWTPRTVNDWRELLTKVPRANCLQSWPFAKALRRSDQKNTRLAVIREEGEDVGLMALQEIKLGPVHILNLHRGPLWFAEKPSSRQLESFADVFSKLYPSRWLRRRRWLPEWDNSSEARSILKDKGFRPPKKGFQTIWIDLEPSLENLRAGLKAKWRNALVKAEKAGMDIQVDDRGLQIEMFLNFYQQHRMKKKYLGYGPKFLREEIQAALPFKEVVMMWAFKDHRPVAGVLLLLHGRSATYRVGWNTEEGRSLNAHNLLLWESLRLLKHRKFTYFDLGGIDALRGEGLTRFKQGLGGEEVELMGIFR
jgi:lipid II:glycine glycyltransferase (peptidoglycan interpeptide bridge formation enzyme)